jgi:lipid-A-disaccharide synthase
MNRKKILVVAGEASADTHAAHVLQKLKKYYDLELIGIGGHQLNEVGLQHPICHAKDMAVVGFTEAVKKIPQTLRLISQLKDLAEKEKPDCALLLDLPDFNLRLAPKLKKLGIPVIYYVSPQVWAWRSGRVHAMAECIDLLLTILPFEKDWYEKNAPEKLKVKYVGHPVLDEIPDLPFEPAENQIAILPGSRESEWRNLFASMIGAAAMMHRGDSKWNFVLPLAEPLRKNDFVRVCLSEQGPFAGELQSLGESFQVKEIPAHEVLRKSKAAWIASGTATLEAAIVGIPMVVVYKVSALTAFIFKNFVRYTGAVAMVNLIHKGLGSADRLVPELLQDEVQPQELCSAMRDVVREENWKIQKDSLSRTRDILKGEGNPLENTANAIWNFLENK